MNSKAISIRPFLGSINFEISRSFYRELGFEEIVLFPKMSLFKNNEIAFYLQDAYVKDWVDNTMVFIEVEDVEKYCEELKSLDLISKYDNVRLEPIRHQDWGSECFLHDPSGILWHFGQFAKK